MWLSILDDPIPQKMMVVAQVLKTYPHQESYTWPRIFLQDHIYINNTLWLQLVLVVSTVFSCLFVSVSVVCSIAGIFLLLYVS